MQKVGPQGVNVKGVSDHIAAGGVRSEPLSAEQGNAMVRDPAAHFDQYRPSTAWGAAQAGVWGAGTGVVLGAGVPIASALWAKKRVDQEDIAAAKKGAMWGAVTGGLGCAASVVSGSTIVGSAAAGAVGMWGAVRRSKDRAEAVREVMVSSASVVAGVGAAALAAPVLGTVGAIVAAPVAATYAGSYARAAAGGGAASWGVWGLRQRLQGTGELLEPWLSAWPARLGAGPTWPVPKL